MLLIVTMKKIAMNKSETKKNYELLTNEIIPNVIKKMNRNN